MSYDERDLSAKQRSLLKREQKILAAAENILTAGGFPEMTLAHIAEKSKCPRANIYHHFSSREDIVVALACKAWEKRLDLMRRGMSYVAPPRIRVTAIGEGFVLFYALYPQYSSILQRATATICEEASPHRVASLRRAEAESAGLMRSLIEEGIRAGDLKSTRADVDEILFAYCAMATGGFALHELGFPETILHVPHAMDKFRRSLNALGDVYEWHPLTPEVDWLGTAADIRRNVFPEESERVYGPGQWRSEWGGHAPSGQQAVVSEDVKRVHWGGNLDLRGSASLPEPENQ